MTDYDDEPLISGLRANVDANVMGETRRNVVVAPQTWGTSVDDLLECVAPPLCRGMQRRERGHSHRGPFDDILCADVLWCVAV